jgi:hypothetical protein
VKNGEILFGFYVYYDSSFQTFRRGQRIVINPNFVVSAQLREDVSKLKKEEGIGKIYSIQTLVDNYGNSLIVCGQDLDDFFGRWL